MAQPAKYMTQQEDFRQTEKDEQTSSPSVMQVPPLFFTLLNILKPFVAEGVKVLIDNTRNEHRVVFYPAKEKQPCNRLKPIPGREAESILTCHQLTISESEDESLTRLIVERMGDVIDNLSTQEKARLLSAFNEDAFGMFLGKSENLCDLQSLQYKCTNRINRLKTKDKNRTPKRPVKEQRKVGDYLYILQPGQKGGDYWYIQFTENGRRKQVYMGKEKPLFEPAKDLALKQKNKPKVKSAQI